MKRVGLALASLGVVLSHARSAGAELHELATRVADSYRAAGARVVILPTRFLYEDETLVLSVPPSVGAKCMTLAIVGARGISFHVGEGDHDEQRDAPDVYSVAGALEVNTCEPRSAEVRVRSDAGRGAIEVVVAYAQVLMPSLRNILPERVGGAMPDVVDPGPVPAMPPPEKRAEAAEASARRDGATVLPRATATATADGSGVVHVRLERGCHRIDLFSPETWNGRRKTRLDLDAELHDQTGDALLARDRGEAADARIEVCMGEPKDTLLGFGGAIPGAPITVARASWPLPSSLPNVNVWGVDANRRFAAALHARHVTPPRAAIALYEGVVGSTSFVARVEPGACYVAVAAAVRGVPRGFVLRARVGATEHSDERGTTDGGALASFCTSDEETVRLTVEARGTALAWGLALFHVTSGGWEREP